jgi:hypothetical protein
MLSFIKYVQCVQHYSKCFTYITSFSPLNKSIIHHALCTDKETQAWEDKQAFVPMSPANKWQRQDLNLDLTQEPVFLNFSLNSLTSPGYTLC